MNQERHRAATPLPASDERPCKRSRLETSPPVATESNIRSTTTTVHRSAVVVSSGNERIVSPGPETGGKLNVQPTTDYAHRLEPRDNGRTVSNKLLNSNNDVQLQNSSNNNNSENESDNLKDFSDQSSFTFQYTHQRQEYDEGMFVYNRALAVDSRASESMRSASLLYNVGLTHVCQGKYKEARQWFELGLVRVILDSQVSTQTALATACIHHNIGHCHYRLGRNEEAMKSYRKALALARDRKLGDLHAAASLNCIGVLLFHNDLNDSKKVLAIFEQCLLVYRTRKGETSPEVGTVLNNIGRVYYLESRYDEALQVYNQALLIRRSLLDRSSIDVAATICNKGQTHHQRGELDDAMVCYQEFLRLAPAKLGSNHRDVAIIYKCVAEIHHEKGELEQARAMYEKALRAGRVALGNFHPELASTLNKLGNLYYELMDLDTALKYYSEGLKVEQVVLEDCHPRIIVTLMNIAQIHRHRGNFAAALVTYGEAHSLQLKALGPNSLDVANTLSSMGLMQYQLKSYSSAFDFYQESLRIQRDHYGSDENLEVASTLNSIGLVLFNQGIYALAKSCFTDSLRIRKAILGSDHRDVAILWYNIATIHLETGDDDLAIKYYKETLRVEQKALGEKHHDVILTLQHLGLVHQQRGELEHALRYFGEALEIERHKQNNGKNQIAVGKLLNLIGNIYLQQANLPKMMRCYTEASRIYRDYAQHNDALVIAGYNFYGLSKLHPPSAAMA